MMNEDNIGQIFRGALKEFEKQPSPGVWNSIQKSLSGVKAPVRSNPLVKNLLISFSAVVITSVLTILAYNHFSKNNAAPVNPSIAQQQEQKVAGPLADQPMTTVTPLKHKNYPRTFIAPSIITENDSVKINDSLSKQITPQKENKDTSKPVNHVIFAEKPLQNDNQSDNNQINNKNISNIEAENDDNLIPVKHSSEITYDQEKTICKGSSVTLHASGGSAYTWINGETTDSITVTPAINTAYHVSIIDKDGIIHEGIINVNVTDCNSYIAPKAFTPDGDGRLDIFFAYVKDVTDFQMIIYSRSGEKIFESRNPDQGWDGTVKGGKAPVGAYVYIIKFIDAFGQQHDLKGSVTLIR